MENFGMLPTLEFVGTWEEIVAHSAELAGQRVRVTVIPPADAATSISTRRPDPPLESEEMAAPYDLPRNAGHPVAYRDGGQRRPELLD
jgi:hypothetical protein